MHECYAVLEVVTVGTAHTAFLSGSVKGGGRRAGTSVEKTMLSPTLLYSRSAFLWRITAFLMRIGVFFAVEQCFPFGGLMFS